MSTGKKLYKLWQRNSSVPIPKRTIARLKKKASKEVDVFSIEDSSSSLIVDTEGEDVIVPDIEQIVEVQDQELLSDDDDETETIASGIASNIDNDVTCDVTNFTEEDDLLIINDDNFHLIEDGEYREYDQFICESEVSESDDSGSDSDDDDFRNRDGVAIYPNAPITSGESILSIMQYAIRQHILL